MHATEHLDELKRYKDFSPTGFDPKGLGLGDQQDWYVAPAGRNRDSGCLDRCNFEVMLEALGGEGDTVQVHCFGHWACGWFEIIIVDPDDEARCETLAELYCSLEDYPILDEMRYSEMEMEEVTQLWEKSRMKERVGWLQKAGLCVFAARHDEYPDDDCGNLYQYLSCEL